MSGSCGRLSWPTALITALAVERLLAAAVARERMRTSQRAGRLVPARRDHLGAEADVLAHAVARRRSARSSRAARRAARRTRASRGWARTSSSRSGWRRRPGSRGSCSRARCRRRRRSSRSRRTGCRPARGGSRRAGPTCRRRSRPRGSRARARPGPSSQATSRASPPSSAISSSIIGTYSSGTSSPTMKLIISRIGLGRRRRRQRAAAIAIGAQRVERHARAPPPCPRRTSRRRPRPASAAAAGSAPRRRLASPVRWTIDIISVGTLACSSAAAMEASSSVTGRSAERIVIVKTRTGPASNCHSSPHRACGDAFRYSEIGPSCTGPLQRASRAARGLTTSIDLPKADPDGRDGAS